MADITRPDNLLTQEAPSVVNEFTILLGGDANPVIEYRRDGQIIDVDFVRKLAEEYRQKGKFVVYLSRREIITSSLGPGKVPFSQSITGKYFINPPTSQAEMRANINMAKDKRNVDIQAADGAIYDYDTARDNIIDTTAPQKPIPSTIPHIVGGGFHRRGKPNFPRR
jgi:hypothetical protein